MGYAMKTDCYRFIEWKDGGTDEVVATELYDHHTDPAENRNLATSPENASLVVTLHERMAAGWQ